MSRRGTGMARLGAGMARLGDGMSRLGAGMSQPAAGMSRRAAALEVAQAAAPVVEAMTTSLRSVKITLCNNSSIMLTNPQHYTYSGWCYESPQSQVENGNKVKCTFGQTRGTACGAVGVLTYDMVQNQRGEAVKRLAIMFSVPFDYNLYSNWFALGLFETTRACDYSLYELMYYYDGSFKREKGNGAEISFHDGGFTLKGTMSNESHSVINLQLFG